MDYYSITTSEVEWRAAICLCGSLSCRGSFLHFATQDDLQQVLVQRCAPAYRVASLLRGCTDGRVSENIDETLEHHGMGTIALGTDNPAAWMKRFAVDILKFLEYERRALPCALLRSRDGSPSPYTFSSADMDARCVLEQRMQSLVCCFSSVSKFLSQQPESFKDKKPLRMLAVPDVVNRVWQLMQSIPGLLHKYVAKAHVAPSSPKEVNSDEDNLISDGEMIVGTIYQIRNKLKPKPTSLTTLREMLKEVRGLVSALHDFGSAEARYLQYIVSHEPI